MTFLTNLSRNLHLAVSTWTGEECRWPAPESEIPGLIELENDELFFLGLKDGEVAEELVNLVDGELGNGIEPIKIQRPNRKKLLNRLIAEDDDGFKRPLMSEIVHKEYESGAFQTEWGYASCYFIPEYEIAFISAKLSWRGPERAFEWISFKDYTYKWVKEEAEEALDLLESGLDD